jgi:GT2 family glycosyltransferase
VSYNRRRVLQDVLENALNQTHPVDEVIVVDNQSGDGTGDMVRQSFPQVTYLAMKENLGSAGGMAAGIKAAYDRGHAWVWMLEDDTIPRPEALETCLHVFHCLNDARVGMVHPWHASRGEIRLAHGLWRGRLRPAIPGQVGEVYDVDVTNWTGNLLRRRVIDQVGFPRSEYFMMWEEFEYCLRIRGAGFRIVVVPKPVIEHLKPKTGHVEPPWRGYYQTRNQLAHALERRSPKELYWWTHRQIHFAIGTLTYKDAKIQRLWFRALGVWDGLRGQTGRTLTPPKPIFQGDDGPED